MPRGALDMLLRVPASSIQLWEPPDDPDKQNLHHVPGFTSKIHRHIAPSSLFEYYNAGTKPRPHLSEEYLKTVTQSKAVVHNPPLETATVAQPETAQLTITSPLGIGPARDPQLVACTVTPHGKSETEITKSFHAAAKIYDPLYYSFKRDIGHYPGDCTCMCKMFIFSGALLTGAVCLLEDVSLLSQKLS